MDDKTPNMHPAKYHGDDAPRNLPPQIMEIIGDNPEVFAEFFRPQIANRFYGMVRNFDNMTVAQQTEFMKLATDVVGVKAIKKQEAQQGATFSIQINIPQLPSTSGQVIDMRATPVDTSAEQLYDTSIETVQELLDEVRGVPNSEHDDGE